MDIQVNKFECERKEYICMRWMGVCVCVREIERESEREREEHMHEQHRENVLGESYVRYLHT